MIRLNQWFLPVLFLRTGAMGEAVTRHSLRPLIAEGHANVSLGRKQRREKADPYPQLAL